MSEKINILMVDDHPGKLLSYEAILKELGENLIAAHSGPEALKQLLKTDVSIILIDVSMPGMDGFELAQMIREHPRFQDTAIIFISALHLTDRDVLKGYEHGAVDYISVPIIPELLRAKVRVFAALWRKKREVDVLNARLIGLQDDERRRIARELHDSVGQLLAAVAMNNDTVRAEADKLSPASGKRLVDNADLVREISSQIRTTSYLLHPPLLDEVGLASALRWYIDEFAKRSGIKVKLVISPNLGPFSKQIEISIFRIIQECLTNVHRHADSPTAEIEIEQDDIQLTVKVADAGRGIPPEKQSLMHSSAQGGVGFRGMQERLLLVNGTLEVESTGHGTCVVAAIPLPWAVGDRRSKRGVA